MIYRHMELFVRRGGSYHPPCQFHEFLDAAQDKVNIHFALIVSFQLEMGQFIVGHTVRVILHGFKPKLNAFAK